VTTTGTDIRKKVAVVFGTRPEAIKFAPLIKELRQDSRLEVLSVTTGQHGVMLDQVLEVFGLTPSVQLPSSSPGQTLSSFAGRTLGALCGTFEQHRPDLVIVQGDTSTAFVAGLSAFYQETPVAHLEAGLRSYDLGRPFPEEGNRVMISRLAAIHLAPTAGNAANLCAEGIPANKVFVTGNTVIDALRIVLARRPPLINTRLIDVLADERPIVTVTAHRRESWGDPLRSIALAIRDLAEITDVRIVWPLHGNPAVRSVVLPIIADHPAICWLEPLAYSDFAQLLGRSHLVISDSGGVQEEAPALGCPVVVLRDVTERSEAVDLGAAVLVGTDRALIVKQAIALLARTGRGIMSPYGDGAASQRCCTAIGSYLFGDEPPAEFEPMLVMRGA
jgi:UDP-N-acetylglucosamine 2-epimerase (non-hydrolysing)